MQLYQQQITIGLKAVAYPTRAQSTSYPSIGELTTYDVPDSDAIYGFTATADSNNDTVSLNVQTGGFTTSLPSSLILGVSGKDFEGVALPNMSKIYGIRVRNLSPGSQTVAVSGTGTPAMFPEITMAAGEDIIRKFPTAGVTASGTLTFTISAASGKVRFEVLAKD